ncbi:MAG: endolytic transglycosylase MltG [Lachnospiraceae bacterium]|nr:endolytic transglycosylase MltG [Lachnospiraceae bacterium]
MNTNKALFTFIKIIFTILVILLIIFGTVRLCRSGYDYGYRFFTETPVDEEPGQDVLVQVDAGMSAKELGEALEARGLIRDAKLFRMQLQLSAYRKSIEPGVYTLNTSMTPKEMMIAMSPKEEETQTQETEAEEAGTEKEE